jgi:hypothetical protein
MAVALQPVRNHYNLSKEEDVPAPGPDDRKALDAVLERAAIDREFRQQLLTDWRRAIKSSFGIEVPPTFTLRFIERDEGVDALIVLPDYRTPADGELSDQDLETVAGGVDDDSWVADDDSDDDDPAPW